jgi:hypothetical protein
MKCKGTTPLRAEVIIVSGDKQRIYDYVNDRPDEGAAVLLFLTVRSITLKISSAFPTAARTGLSVLAENLFAPACGSLTGRILKLFTHAALLKTESAFAVVKPLKKSGGEAG